MLYFGWDNIQCDVLIRNNFYNLVIKFLNEMIAELIKAKIKATFNITNMLLDVLKRYEVTNDDDMILFGKYMPMWFKCRMQQIYKSNGIFFNTFKVKDDVTIFNI